MRFGKSAPALLITATIIVVASISLISNRISHQMASSFEDSNFELMSRILHSKIRGAEGKAIAAAEMIAAIPAVKRAFAEQDKDELLRLTKDAYAVQHEKYGISQAQFHLAPAQSFLRVHNPSRPPEDLSKYRTIVVEVNRTNAIRKGIEITTSGIGVFGTLPMTDEAGKATGSFEMAMEIGPLLDELKKTYGFELALFVDETLLRATATSLGPDILNDQNRVGNFIKFYSTHSELIRSLVTGDDIAVTEEASYVRDADGAPYGILVQPVYSYAGKQIGVITVVNSFAATRSADGQAKVWQTLLGVVSIILLIGVVLIVLRGLLLQPLAAVGERFAALADGDHTRPIEPAAIACPEIRDLADSYERLRARAGGQDRGEGGAP